MQPLIDSKANQSAPGQLRIFNFLRFSNISFLFSGILLLCSIGLLCLRGLHWGLDFTGGTLVEVKLGGTTSIDSVRSALEQNGFPEAVIQHSDSSKDLLIRLAPHQDMAQAALQQRLVELICQASGSTAVVHRLEFVGPSIGKELAQNGVLAILAALLAILFYVGLRFEWRLAAGGVLALAHDVIITLGILSLLQVDIDLTIIAALLSVVGYSLNDTIVVFDRIRENFRCTLSSDVAGLINKSLSQTLGRTLMTSGTTLLVVLALLAFGGPALFGFSLVLLSGIVVGTFSSIYVASAIALKLGLRREHLLTRPLPHGGSREEL